MRFQSILLLGPTGAGKTPLGQWLERNSLWGRDCHHFDFGENLRAIVAGQNPNHFAPEEIHFLRRILKGGDLLDDEHFPLAARILRAYVAGQRVQAADLLLLNGLPRHVGQARALAQHVAIVGILNLDADAPTVLERLRRNSGADRAERTDDAEDLVARKLAIYEDRTRPLLDYYHQQGTPILPIQVGTETQPAEIAARMQGWRVFS